MDEKETNFNYRDLVKFSKTIPQKFIFIKCYVESGDELETRYVRLEDYKNVLADSKEYMTSNKAIEDYEIYIIDCIEGYYLTELSTVFTLPMSDKTYTQKELLKK